MSAASLAEAEELLRHERPGTIIMDLHFPDGEGVEAVRRIKEAAYDDPEIIVYTSAVDRRLKADLQALGVDLMHKDLGLLVNRVQSSPRRESGPDLKTIEKAVLDRFQERMADFFRHTELAVDAAGTPDYALLRTLAGLGRNIIKFRGYFIIAVFGVATSIFFGLLSAGFIPLLKSWMGAPP